MSEGDIFGEFSSITGVTDESEVVNYLAAADFQLQSAIDLYFASAIQSDGLKPKSSSTAGGLDEEEYVRRPDEVKRSRLMDESDLEHLELIEKSRPTKNVSAFGSAAPSGKGNNKKPRLATLYSAPTDINCSYPYDDMIDLAKVENKWVVVNIQSDSEFLSHQLNRDVWGDETMKDMLRCSYYFWQKLDISLEGTQFSSRYKVSKFPFVAIINPITGAAVWKIEGQFEPSRLIDKLQDFVGSYANPSEFVMGRSARVSVASSSQPIPKELNFQQMDTAKISPPLEINHTGFNKEEILKFRRSDQDSDKTITLKIRLPSGSFVLKLADDCTIMHLLAEICSKFGDNAPQYFDVMHGFPQIKLSEEISQEESKLKTLKDVNIVTNSVLTVNFPSV